MQLEQANLILKDFAQSRARATSHSQSGGKWRSVAAALLTLLREKHTYCHRRMKTKWYNQVTRDDVKHPFPLSWKQCKSYILAAQSLEILSTVEVAHDQIGDASDRAKKNLKVMSNISAVLTRDDVKTNINDIWPKALLDLKSKGKLINALTLKKQLMDTRRTLSQSPAVATPATAPPSALAQYDGRVGVEQQGGHTAAPCGTGAVNPSSSRHPGAVAAAMATTAEHEQLQQASAAALPSAPVTPAVAEAPQQQPPPPPAAAAGAMGGDASGMSAGTTDTAATAQPKHLAAHVQQQLLSDNQYAIRLYRLYHEPGRVADVIAQRFPPVVAHAAVSDFRILYLTNKDLLSLHHMGLGFHTGPNGMGVQVIPGTKARGKRNDGSLGQLSQDIKAGLVELVQLASSDPVWGQRFKELLAKDYADLATSLAQVFLAPAHATVHELHQALTLGYHMDKQTAYALVYLVGAAQKSLSDQFTAVTALFYKQGMQEWSDSDGVCCLQDLQQIDAVAKEVLQPFIDSATVQTVIDAVRQQLHMPENEPVPSGLVQLAACYGLTSDVEHVPELVNSDMRRCAVVTSLRCLATEVGCHLKRPFAVYISDLVPGPSGSFIDVGGKDLASTRKDDEGYDCWYQNTTQRRNCLDVPFAAILASGLADQGHAPLFSQRLGVRVHSGINTEAGIGSMTGTTAPVHIEDLLLGFLNLLLYGDFKIWRALKRAAPNCAVFKGGNRTMLAVAVKEEFTPLQDLVPTAQLRQCIRTFIQVPGMMVVCSPGWLWHSTTSVGFSFATASNWRGLDGELLSQCAKDAKQHFERLKAWCSSSIVAGDDANNRQHNQFRRFGYRQRVQDELLASFKLQGS